MTLSKSHNLSMSFFLPINYFSLIRGKLRSRLVLLWVWVSQAGEEGRGTKASDNFVISESKENAFGEIKMALHGPSKQIGS